MPAFIRFDGVDGEVDAAHSEANWELTVKVLDAGTCYGGTTDVDLAIRVVDTETSTGGAGTEIESTLIYNGESGGMVGDPVGPFSAFDASLRGGVEVPANGIGGPQHIHVDSGDNLWIVPGDTAPDGFALAPDAAEQHKDHKNWINVASCNMGGHKAGGGSSADDTPMSWDILKQSPWNGTAEAGGHAKWIEVESTTWGDAGSGHASPTGGTGHYTQLIWADSPVVHGTGGGGGAGKVSVHDVSLSTSVPKAAAGDTVELVEVHFSFREIEIEHGGELGVEDLASADADTSALGNTYLGVTTIEQGVLQVEHSTMMLSFQYYMA